MKININVRIISHSIYPRIGKMSMKIWIKKSMINFTSSTIAITMVTKTPTIAFARATSGFQNHSPKVSGFAPIGELEKSQNQGTYWSTEIGKFIMTAEVPFNLVDTSLVLKLKYLALYLDIVIFP